MMESTERVGAHKHHPNFNLKNARRLIAALQRSVPARIARERPMEIGGSPVIPVDILHMAVDAEGTDPKGVPLAYHQASWGSMVKDSLAPSNSCGTAACIAGFAFLMLKADKGAKARVVDLVTGSVDVYKGKMDALAEFLGVSLFEARCMSTPHCEGVMPQPRHAVAMLERFVETGEADWHSACGFVERRRRRRDWRNWRPWKVRKWVEWEPTEKERRDRREDDQKIEAAIAGRRK